MPLNTHLSITEKAYLIKKHGDRTMLTPKEYLTLLDYSKKGANLPCGTLKKMHEFEEHNNLLVDAGNGVTRIKPLETEKHRRVQLQQFL